MTDESGWKTPVILPIEDLAVLLERRDEPTIPLEDVIAELKQDGILPD